MMPRRVIAPPLTKEVVEQPLELAFKIKALAPSTSSMIPIPRPSSDHTYLSADGARVSFITAKQEVDEIKAYQQLRALIEENKE